MGKKSKRRGGNRNQTNQSQTRGVSTKTTNDEFPRIERTVKDLYEDACNLHGKSLLSQAHAKLSNIVSLLEANKDTLMKNHPDYYKHKSVHVHEKIANLEVRQRNFQAIISIGEFCNSIFFMSDKLYVLYHLALVVRGSKDWYEASEEALNYAQYTFSRCQSDQSQHSLYQRNDHLDSFGIYWHYFLIELRLMRKWDEALDFTNKFGRYIEGSKLLYVDFLHVATYIERYRVEARKRPRDERNKMSVSLYKYIFAKFGDGFSKIVIETRETLTHPYMLLLSAQWLYLNHQGTVEQRAKEKDTAIFLVQEYIETDYEDTAMHNCLGCEQKSTTSDPLLVCSGCRVVCYCCIDHQRSSWKKEVHWGVGIGHKILCPLYKAYHKYKNARNSRGKNVDEYHLRFQSECEKFLSDGLGLKELCFSRDFVDNNGDEFRCADWRNVLSSGFENTEYSI